MWRFWSKSWAQENSTLTISRHDWCPRIPVRFLPRANSAAQNFLLLPKEPCLESLKGAGGKLRHQVAGHEQALSVAAGPIFGYWRMLLAGGTVWGLARSVLSRAWGSKVYLLVTPQVISLSEEARFFFLLLNKVCGGCLEGHGFPSVTPRLCPRVKYKLWQKQVGKDAHHRPLLQEQKVRSDWIVAI